MVFCGKPSQACHRCRQRRIKCDQIPYGCGQCTRQSIQCPGYRNQLDLTFRDQSEAVARKVITKRLVCEEHTCGEAQERRINGGKCTQQKTRLTKTVDKSQHQVSGKGGESSEDVNAIVNFGKFHDRLAAQSFDTSTRLSILRLDHLESYSETDRPRVIQCLNYYVKFCGPNYVWRDEVIITGSTQRFANDFLNTSLAEPAFLESILAICQADIDLRRQPGSPPSRAALQHRSRALGLLRNKLSPATTSNEEVVLAIVLGMMTYDMIMSDWISYEIHLRYLREIILFHGGTEALGWQGWFAYAYTWAELRWANHLAHRASIIRTESLMNSRLSYSMHPISTNMGFWTLKLPVGFHNIAKSNLLGEKVGELLVEVEDWTHQCKGLQTSFASLGKLNKRGLGLAGMCAKLISSIDLSRVESLVCTAIVAYIVSLIEGPAGHSRGLEELTINLDLHDLENLDLECRLWVATTVAAANDTFPATLPNRWTLLDQVLASETVCQEWPEVTDIFQRFFWDERHAERWKQCWVTAVQRKITSTS